MTDKCISCSFLVIDNFYENPDEVREIAISTHYRDVNTGWGYKSNMFECNILTSFFKQFFSYYDDKIIVNNCRYFFIYDIFHAVPKCIKRLNAKWIAMIFLTPDISNYLEFFEYIDKNVDDCSKCYTDATRWKVTDRIKTRYNRLIIFNSDNYFTFMKSIGSSIETSQIVQLITF